MNLNAYFPTGRTPNESQEKILEKLTEFFASKQKYCVISAPTGAGKSFIAKTLSNYSKDIERSFKQDINDYSIYSDEEKQNEKSETREGAFILTLTKSLQDQYQRDFSDLMSFKGKSNHQCDVEDTVTVDMGPCNINKILLRKCWGENRCPYFKQRNSALASKHAVLNYSMFVNLPEYMKYRQFIICDEASELEDTIVEMFSLNIERKKFKSFDIDYPLFSPNAKTSFLTKVLDKVNEVIEVLDKSKAELTVSKTKKLMFCREMQGKLSAILSYVKNVEFIFQETNDGIHVAPYRVKALSGELFKYGEKVILLSATFVDYKKTCEDLGIPLSDVFYIEVPSVFDPKKGQIIMNNKFFINHKNIDEQLPKLLHYIKAVMAKHPNERGVVHTSTLKITRYLQEHIKDPRCIFRESGVLDNQQLMELHKDKTNSVIFTPSMGLGSDFKDDLARFQIIAKLSYPSLQSDRIKKLFEEDKEWYSNKTLSNFIQTCGRVQRNINDWGITYVPDGSAYRLIVDNKDKIPPEFLNRIA